MQARRRVGLAVVITIQRRATAQSQVKFCGQIIGSGKRFADREKIKVVDEMENPKTKTELRRILGFLTFFREHIEGFAEIAKPLTLLLLLLVCVSFTIIGQP